MLPIQDPWSDPNRYVMDIEENDEQCIAPTKNPRRPRCTTAIAPQHFTEALELKEEIQGLKAGSERIAAIERRLLLLCCGEWHREKLVARSACLSILVCRYDALMSAESLKPRSQPQTPKQGAARISPAHTPSRWRETPNRALYELKPRNREHVNADLKFVDRRVFVPYKSAAADHINSCLIADVPKAEVKRGSVYAFTWPAHPCFVKIGYTRKSAAARVEEWTDCHPGATLLLAETFECLERMERLFHLQMENRRRKMMLCQTCSKEHQEWFEMSEEIVENVFHEWHEVVRRSPLYDNDGKLASDWTMRKKRFSEKITAAELLCILDREEEQLRQEEREKNDEESMLAKKLIQLSLTTAEQVH